MTPKSQMNASWYADPSRGSVPDSFNLFQEQFLKPLGKTAVNIEREKESAEYGAVRFEMDGQTCLFRQSKHTPKKSANLSRFGNARQCPAKSRRLTTTTALIR